MKANTTDVATGLYDVVLIQDWISQCDREREREREKGDVPLNVNTKTNGSSEY